MLDMNFLIPQWLLISFLMILIVIALIWLMMHKQKQYQKYLLGEIQTIQSNLQVFQTLMSQQSHGQIAQQDQYQKQLKTYQDLLQENLKTQIASLFAPMDQQLMKSQQAIANQFCVFDQRLSEKMSLLENQMKKGLDQGFEKTISLFENVNKHLGKIDSAQKQIADLSLEIFDLKSILNDKKSRGVMGEVQLELLIKNALPKSHVSFQHQLSNRCLVDCLIKLPSPAGNLGIDAKFPLEDYKRWQDNPRDKVLATKFKTSIKTHINHIAEKYIIAGETGNGAIMFMPSETIFADIHSQFYELVFYAQKKQVWIVSPTTMMAVITTALCVIKNDATQNHIKTIQYHLSGLNQEFERFKKRMDQLAKHIDQAQQDVTLVQTTSKKISNRFHQIENTPTEEIPPSKG